MNIFVWHIRHIKNGDIFGTGQRLHEFIWNLDQPESFCCYNTYINTCGYMCDRHSKKGWFNIQCPIWYMLS